MRGSVSSSLLRSCGVSSFQRSNCDPVDVAASRGGSKAAWQVEEWSGGFGEAQQPRSKKKKSGKSGDDQKSVGISNGKVASQTPQAVEVWTYQRCGPIQPGPSVSSCGPFVLANEKG